MEIFSLLFMMAMPLAFLSWTLRFKGHLAFLTIAPLMMINVIVISLNSGFDQAHPPALQYTHNEILNQTAVTSGGNTTTTNNYGPVTDNIVIGFQNMNILNSLMGIFTIVVVFVVFRRVTRYRKRDPDDNY